MLSPLNQIENYFLRDLGMSAFEAFDRFSLAPLALRRDIAMLGLIHKCTLGIAHVSLQALFPSEPFQHQQLFPTRLARRRHSRQLLERCDGRHLEILNRSIFGLVRIYNLLEQRIVDAPTVRCFQKRLTKLAHVRSQTDLSWPIMFSPRVLSFINKN